jgi:cyclopropane fatty-acyl-phospholipid synthase-like methyltransferase
MTRRSTKSGRSSRPPSQAEELDLESEVLARNCTLYDHADDRIWRLAVYDPVHGGRRFTNIGGRYVLDQIGRYAGCGPDTRAVELCCGMGDTCTYLAEQFGCRVLGFDLNANQIRRALERAATLPADVAARLTFLRKDARAWDDREAHDLVYCIESLMLVNDVPGVIGRAAGALRPRGSLLLAELTAGPACREEFLRRAWEMDGMIDLPSPAGYVDMLSVHGIEGVEVEDLTDRAVACFATIQRSLGTNRERLAESCPAEAIRGWTDAVAFYLEAFRARVFGYTFFSGRRRSSG